MHQLSPSGTEGDKEDPNAQHVQETESLQLIDSDECDGHEYPVGDDCGRGEEARGLCVVSQALGPARECAMGQE
jgi:hypothetical protein